jgi:hypothetical protein
LLARVLKLTEVQLGDETMTLEAIGLKVFKQIFVRTTTVTKGK